MFKMKNPCFKSLGYGLKSYRKRKRRFCFRSSTNSAIEILKGLHTLRMGSIPDDLFMLNDSGTNYDYDYDSMYILY